MKCTNCKFENAGSAKFCIKCGSPLTGTKPKNNIRAGASQGTETIGKHSKKFLLKLKSPKVIWTGLIVLGIMILFFVLKQPIANMFFGKPEMVYVKGGSFNMGSYENSDEKPVHTVTLSSFYMGKYGVTQKQWRDVMGSNPSRFSGCDGCPVEQVSWNDVQNFIEKLNKKTGKKYRLPTEAEWEFAARGGNKSKGYEYAGSDNINDVAWYTKNSYDKGENHSDYGTHKTGTKKANELGIYDMSGNVWEWCSDWYDSDYYSQSPKSNPQGPSGGSNRVSRGGSWFDFAGRCRVAYRSSFSPDRSYYYLGFRLALSP